ncbi:MAG: DNA-binding protein WhiA [Oscillospiraceae bacterium]|nr:DNA-binding protein WhiA [Oscillospiraceae bacterium]
MSFSGNVKAELCRQPMVRHCCAVAECYGVLLYCNTFSGSAIKVVTESQPLAQRLPKLFHRAFGLEFDAVPDTARPGKLVLEITKPEKIRQVFGAFGYTADQMLALHLNLGVLENECCRTAFLRGAFLAGGSVTDPGKRYHLELATPHFNVSRETYSLLLEQGFSPKDTTRAGNLVVYFKQSDFIEDFLTMAGAPVCAMRIMEAKVEKDLRNGVNRRVNCETANLTKVVDAAQEQMLAIRVLQAKGLLDTLPPRLRESAMLRMENPEATLQELAQMVMPPLTKSAMNHRMRKLIALSKQ